MCHQPLLLRTMRSTRFVPSWFTIRMLGLGSRVSFSAGVRKPRKEVGWSQNGCGGRAASLPTWHHWVQSFIAKAAKPTLCVC